MSAFTEKITTQRKNRDAGRGSWSPPCLSLSSLFFPPVSLQMNRSHICDSWDPVSVVLVRENRIEKPNMMSLELQFCPLDFSVTEVGTSEPTCPFLSLCASPDLHLRAISASWIFLSLLLLLLILLVKGPENHLSWQRCLQGGKESRKSGPAAVPLAGEGGWEAWSNH